MASFLKLIETVFLNAASALVLMKLNVVLISAIFSKIFSIGLNKKISVLSSITAMKSTITGPLRTDLRLRLPTVLKPVTVIVALATSPVDSNTCFNSEAISSEKVLKALDEGSARSSI